MKTKRILNLISMVISAVLWVSCSKKQGEFLKFSVLPDYVVVIASQDANHAGVAYYNLDGDFLGYITDFKDIGAVPRGLAKIGDNNLVVSVDVADGIHEISIQEKGHDAFYGSPLFSGNIYDIVAGIDRLFAIESNRIEVFNYEGLRMSSELINTTVGGCTLSNPRGLEFQESTGYLVVTNQGGADNILRYDVSSGTASCVSSVAFGNNPWGVASSSNGKLFIATQGDDQIYKTDSDGSNATVIFSTDTTVINDPTALTILPNGDLLVASSATDSIERLTPSGTRIGDSPFIKDSFSLNVSDISVLKTQER
ncbi:MAG: hypothetical protein KDD25_08395 [Bdellovibrionales bacterium]|nr:hypothetical protein [Bdellovibrionales bacterium]